MVGDILTPAVRRYDPSESKMNAHAVDTFGFGLAATVFHGVEVG
ncbi:MAG: hypothetical protein OYM47_11530 [Gemmatimonadota bacterium]|nr:hypothetical protein [Gemmatimonadota bacterium]